VSLQDLTDRAAVMAAMDEFDRMGRDAFLSSYGFGPSSKFVLVRGDREYDSKAILGAAHKHQLGVTLKSGDFNGGAPVLAKARELGIEVRRIGTRSDLGAALADFLDAYPSARAARFGTDPAPMQHLRRAAAAITALLPEPLRSAHVRPSVGQGNWAMVPWLAVLVPEETTTTQHGTYPVLLFPEDMTGVEVTIAQGITDLRNERGRREARVELHRRASVLRPHLQALQALGFSADAQYSLGSGDLARDYVDSTVVHKRYGRDSVRDAPVAEELEVLLEEYANVLDAGRLVFSAPPSGSSLAIHAGPQGGAAASLREVAAAFRTAVDGAGLVVPRDHEDRVVSLLAAVVTKPFVILSGMSGSGKTQLALRLGEWFGEARAQTVAVRPDWTGPEALLGYEDALQPKVNGRSAWFAPTVLRFLLQAHREPDMPYLLLLDEMNLAHVERYFSDFLSGIESRKPVLPNLVEEDGVWRLDPLGPELLPIPRNLVVVGTVNVDETTYLFSPKVLDRACTFEVRTRTEELDPAIGRPRELQQAEVGLLSALREAMTDDRAHLEAPAAVADEVADALRRLHEALSHSGDEFGHRVFGEALRIAWAFEAVGGPELDRILDHIVLLKVLPKLHGSRRRIEPVLDVLLGFAIDPSTEPIAPPEDREIEARLPLAAAKLRRMLRSVEVNQFVSFSE
jgi:5-methylcytosine-specific restriction enzyme B